MKCKLVNVYDRATEYVALVCKFDESDVPFLEKVGWGDVRDLTFVSIIGPYTSAVLSRFDYPPYDIRERSDKMDVNATTIKLTEYLRDKDFSQIPTVIDLTRFKSQYVP